MDRINEAVSQLRVFVGVGGDDELSLEQDENLTFMDEFNRSCTLSRKQRLQGFAACLAIGFFCSFLSLLLFLHPMKFAVTFTFGNLISLGSTGFLIGPKQQMKMMMDPARIVATIVYFCSMFFALFSALYFRNLLLTLVAIIVEGCALIWYCLSYIPFARAAVRRCFNNCWEMEI